MEIEKILEQLIKEAIKLRTEGKKFRVFNKKELAIIQNFIDDYLDYTFINKERFSLEGLIDYKAYLQHKLEEGED